MQIAKAHVNIKPDCNYYTKKNRKGLKITNFKKVLLVITAIAATISANGMSFGSGINAIGDIGNSYSAKLLRNHRNKIIEHYNKHGQAGLVNLVNILYIEAAKLIFTEMNIDIITKETLNNPEATTQEHEFAMEYLIYQQSNGLNLTSIYDNCFSYFSNIPIQFKSQEEAPIEIINQGPVDHSILDNSSFISDAFDKMPGSDPYFGTDSDW